jgi:hypothetical protein
MVAKGEKGKTSYKLVAKRRKKLKFLITAAITKYSTVETLALLVYL